MSEQPIGLTALTTDSNVYNPIDELALIESATRQLEAQPFYKLSELSKFNGSGVYALYYTGTNENYKTRLSKPIYIGKACGGKSRKGLKYSATGTALYRRLKDHAKSISQVDNLNINDFYFRFMLTGEAVGVLTEWALIQRYRSVWNCVIDGFGNHDQGKARRTQQRSAWDTLHPGRKWAESYTEPNKSMPKVLDQLKSSNS